MWIWTVISWNSYFKTCHKLSSNAQMWSRAEIWICSCDRRVLKCKFELTTEVWKREFELRTGRVLKWRQKFWNVNLCLWGDLKYEFEHRRVFKCEFKLLTRGLKCKFWAKGKFQLMTVLKCHQLKFTFLKIYISKLSSAQIHLSENLQVLKM